MCLAQQIVSCQMGFVGKFERIVNRDPVEETVEDNMFSLQSRKRSNKAFVGAEKVQ